MTSLLGSVSPAAKKLPESNMLHVEAKRTDRLTWTPHLRKYISNGYAEHPDLYTDDFRILDELRNDCIYMEPSLKGLNRLIKFVSNRYIYNMHLFPRV